MEYISAKEFLKKPKEVQEVFIDWWRPSKGDINYSPVRNGIEVVEIENNSVQRRNNGYIPLLTEGQLRKFIEDKTECKICLEYYKTTGYEVLLSDIEHNKENAEQFNNWYEDLGTDLLQAYWKVACEIAKEG